MDVKSVLYPPIHVTISTSQAASLSPTKLIAFPTGLRLPYRPSTVIQSFIRFRRRRGRRQAAVKAYRSRFPINKASPVHDQKKSIESSHKLNRMAFYASGIAYKLLSSWNPGPEERPRSDEVKTPPIQFRKVILHVQHHHRMKRTQGITSSVPLSLYIVLILPSSAINPIKQIRGQGW